MGRPASSRTADGRRARALGRRGERCAARHLRRQGYRIHARNLRTPRGEIDLLAEEGGCLVLVEVKTTARRGGATQLPPLRRAQRERLIAAGRWICSRSRLENLRIRHDLAVVTLDGWRSVVTIRRDVFRP